MRSTSADDLIGRIPTCPRSHPIRGELGQSRGNTDLTHRPDMGSNPARSPLTPEDTPERRAHPGDQLLILWFRLALIHVVQPGKEGSVLSSRRRRAWQSSLAGELAVPHAGVAGQWP